MRDQLADEHSAAVKPARAVRGGLARSFGYAFRGIAVTFKSERNFRVHVAATCVAVALGLYLGLTLLEWGLIVFAIGLVLGAETFNTAMERLADAASGGKQSPSAKDIKDISAAAVLLCAATALGIGVLILVVPLVHKLAALF